jgi:hypothetical protein
MVIHYLNKNTADSQTHFEILIKIYVKIDHRWMRRFPTATKTWMKSEEIFIEINSHARGRFCKKIARQTYNLRVNTVTMIKKLFWPIAYTNKVFTFWNG